MQFHLQWATEHFIFAKEKKSSSVPKNYNKSKNTIL